MQLTTEFREKVRIAIVEASANYSGSDADYSKLLGINKTVYSQIKNGKTERILSDNIWLTLGRRLNVTLTENKWKGVVTQVYTKIESDLRTCKEKSMSKMLVDDFGIGKTYCAKVIARKMKDTFYVDCSQATTKMLFVRELASIVGVENKGRYVDVLNNLKYYLNTVLIKPLIILDEAGDLEKDAFKVLKALWNSTEYNCGWYMMGADDLKEKLSTGKEKSKNSMGELLDRYNQDFSKISPLGKEDRISFYRKLISQVAKANLNHPENINKEVNKIINSVDKKQASLRTLRTNIQHGA